MSSVRGNIGFYTSSIQKSKTGAFYLDHEEYGRIPLIAKGHAWMCDRNYRPPMPAGAIRGDIWKQRVEPSSSVTTSWSPGFGIPRYFYKDHEFRCRVCHKVERFTAAEQQLWYETYRIPVYVDANRCGRCRMAHRSAKDLSVAVSQARAKPGDPLALLNEAKGRIVSFQLTGGGDLNRAMACLRAVLRLKPNLHEAILCEGLIHQLRGRYSKARAAYGAFLSAKPIPPIQLRRAAERHLAGLPA